ncbi:hypothetical protein [Pseudomonas kurunegalensis]|uniref:hypothetical protein n=1 Tax=Pseudomonas kurunegalensis TaxID=485880 RepID=UPI0023638442|nr:hypothetical protein [Pseudomonas kurunegalensis]MDD2133470.1 hypothetical protein [Pseudomonas kurunegalensis]
MINLSTTNAVWLIPDHEIGLAFATAADFVKKAYNTKYSTPARGNQLGRLIRDIQGMGVFPFSKWNKAEIQTLLSNCFYKVNSLSAIKAFKGFTPTTLTGLNTFIKLVFIRLWGEKKVLLPVRFTLPTGLDAIIDRITLQTQSESLYLTRSINDTSALPYEGAMSKHERDLRASYWYRFILTTSIYQPSDLRESDIHNSYSSSVGKNSLLGRFYINDLLLTLAEKTPLRDKLHQFLSEAKDKVRLAQETAKPIWQYENKEKKSFDTAEQALRFLSVDNPTTSELAQIYKSANHVRLGFSITDTDKLPGGYKYLPEKVVNFCSMINIVYRSYVASRRLVRDKELIIPLNHLLMYCGLYLYKFYMSRDGHLGKYPQTLDDFACSVYFTADRLLLDGLVTFTEKQPETFLSFLNHVGNLNNWCNTTQYNRVAAMDHFCTYIVDNSLTIPDSKRFKNSFSDACYPKLARSYGTKKKPVPRAYFATFLSMLYSMEYFVMHLNEMADGTMPGVIGGELVCPNLSELENQPDWAGLWGRGVLSGAPVRLETLNYCPIFYHEDQIQRFEYIPHFYKTSQMHIDGRVQSRVVTNDIRMTQLMCETGIRQHHLLWLDKDKYDVYLDRSSRRMLAPLFVSSDKSHGEWSAITSRNVIDLLDRQRTWYDRCTSPDYQKDLWYGMTAESKFGAFKPLFRLSINSKLWFNYRSFPFQLLTLQYFIRNTLGDLKLPDLVFKRHFKNSSSITDYAHKELEKITSKSLTSKITPHGLRAGFVSEAIKFLPPFLIGKYLTGQTEELVYYYALIDDDVSISHEQLLTSVLMKNAAKIEGGDAPKLAEAILKLNQRLYNAIKENPDEAITTHRLMSLMAAKDDKNGIDLIRAKEVTALAFNSTHICPFNNICPREVAQMFGATNICALCPYAIRGIDHLPAISAEKDKFKELMIGVLQMIAELMKRKPEKRNESDVAKLEQEHDHFARQAVVLEAIEMQLVEMSNSNQYGNLIVKNKEEVLGHYARFALKDEEKMLKRLIDVQNFPDLTSPDLECRLAHLRAVLMMHDGSLRDHLRIPQKRTGTIASQVATQISSMVSTGVIEPFYVYQICAQEHRENKALEKPINVISQYIS